MGTSISDRAAIDRLKKEYKDAETEIERLQREMDRLQGRKQQILTELGEYLDKQSEENMLAQVYEQRRHGSK